ALDDVAAEAVADAERALQVDAVAGPQAAEVRLRQGLRADLEAHRLGVVRDDGEAAAVDGDALADGELRRDARLGDDEVSPGPGGVEAADGAQGFHEAGEHADMIPRRPAGHKRRRFPVRPRPRKRIS